MTHDERSLLLFVAVGIVDVVTKLTQYYIILKLRDMKVTDRCRLVVLELLHTISRD
jgi:hypothetical protein